MPHPMRCQPANGAPSATAVGAEDDCARAEAATRPSPRPLIASAAAYPVTRADATAVGPRRLPSDGVTSQLTVSPGRAAPLRIASDKAAIVTCRRTRPPAVHRER